MVQAHASSWTSWRDKYCYASVCIFSNRPPGALFTRPRSMDNMRKSKSIFPVDVRLTLKIRCTVIRSKSILHFYLIKLLHEIERKLRFKAVYLPTLNARHGSHSSRTVTSNRWKSLGRFQKSRSWGDENLVKVVSNVWWWKQIFLHTVRSHLIRQFSIQVLKISL